MHSLYIPVFLLRKDAHNSLFKPGGQLPGYGPKFLIGKELHRSLGHIRSYGRIDEHLHQGQAAADNCFKGYNHHPPQGGGGIDAPGLAFGRFPGHALKTGIQPDRHFILNCLKPDLHLFRPHGQLTSAQGPAGRSVPVYWHHSLQEQGIELVYSLLHRTGIGLALGPFQVFLSGFAGGSGHPYESQGKAQTAADDSPRSSQKIKASENLSYLFLHRPALSALKSGFFPLQKPGYALIIYCLQALFPGRNLPRFSLQNSMHPA